MPRKLIICVHNMEILVRLMLSWGFPAHILMDMKYLNISAAKRRCCRHWSIYSIRQEESWYLCFRKTKEPFSSWIQPRHYFSCQSWTWIKFSLSPMWSRSHRKRKLEFPLNTEWSHSTENVIFFPELYGKSNGLLCRVLEGMDGISGL